MYFYYLFPRLSVCCNNNYAVCCVCFRCRMAPGSPALSGSPLPTGRFRWRIRQHACRSRFRKVSRRVILNNQFKATSIGQRTVVNRNSNRLTGKNMVSRIRELTPMVGLNACSSCIGLIMICYTRIM